MSAAGRTGTDARGAVSDAEFVRLIATADGDALAATGLFARMLDDTGVPYQASLAAVPEPPATDADCTVAVGHADGDVALSGDSLALEAFDIATEIDQTAADPTLALAGARCAGADLPSSLLERAELERQPGVAVPTTEPVEGLTASTLLRAPFSGDSEAVASALEGIDAEDGRTLASFVALSVLEDAPPRAAESIETTLRPYTTERFETLGGFADVLDALARERPGTGIALALGRGVEESAQEVWAEHGHRVHAALTKANDSRYEGLYALTVDETQPARLGSIAEICFRYRSPEPTVVVAADGAAAVHGEQLSAESLSAAAEALDGRSSTRKTAGTAVFDGTAAEFTRAFREAL